MSLVFVLISVQFTALYAQPEVCSFLLRLGLDPDRADNSGR